METNRSIRASILPGMWTTSLDLTDLFSCSSLPFIPQIPSVCLEQKGLPIQGSPFWSVNCTTSLYQTHAGSNCSPSFTGYSDSFLPGRLTDQGTFSRETLSQYRCSHQIAALSLGFLISWKKSDLIPSQDFIFLGEHYLTHQCIVRPPQEKFQNLCSKIHLFLSQKTVTARQFSQLLGLLNSLADVVPLGRLHIRPLQFYLHQHWLPATQDWEFPVPIIHQELFPHLVWWTSQANVLRGQLLSSPVPNQTLFTDASNLGWGAYLEVPTAEQISGSSNGQHHCGGLFAKPRGNSLLRAVSFSKRNPSFFAINLHLQIVVRHVPGKLNVLADALSRTLTPVNTEWELLQSVFQAITLQWGSPHVDLFATSLNYKVQVFMSPVPDPKAYAVDCMSVPWDGMFAYAFPPFRFLSQVLRKISAEQGLIILIAPAWPKQAWFPDLLHLSCARPLVLPVRHNLLSQFKGKILHPNPEKLHLFAWLLSGIASRREVFLNAQPDISPEQSEIPLTSSMMPSGLSSVVGVRTRSLRTSSNSRLFIPINKGKQDLSAKTISTWICKTIQLAYSFSNEELLNSMHIKAHDVRAISTSWALFNNASLEEVLSAGFWRTENSFISHYLQSLATQAQSLYSLGPLVSAQRVVFPPASSGSGDSALWISHLYPINGIQLFKPKINSGRGSEPIVIPALPVDSSSKVLCPIRVLLLYLQRTQSLRTSSNSRLFIPINKGKQDLSVKTISTWICKTIQLAYSFSNEELLNSMHIKAHDVRAISTSWALFNNASLEEVLSAGFWRTENSFISHYLQSLATQAQSLYSLGPLVSAQRVVFPPASSGSGDSALC
ncbi:Hypothetical predicted protein [Mytilus galloprovincialis]|uniref:Uncharacterized protein n=1 Tax=Mytilus galloprovincialis TaxID=29158 RepID=A0A8B6FK34_MYTGA|nr:Hypothetical predicted protein [Mytilus galloprovincialis]